MATPPFFCAFHSTRVRDIRYASSRSIRILFQAGCSRIGPTILLADFCSSRMAARNSPAGAAANWRLKMRLFPGPAACKTTAVIGGSQWVSIDQNST